MAPARGTAQLRRELSALDIVASGTIHTRMKMCGKPNCKCAVDPAARHGPYHEWSHRQVGRLVSRMVSVEQAALLAEAIANYRQIKKLLARWQRETAREILHPDTEAQ